MGVGVRGLHCGAEKQRGSSGDALRWSWDGNGKVLQVQGEGVVGETPYIKPGETFEYTSGTPLKTSSGIMQGYYSMKGSKGEHLKIDIPAFSLDSPYEKKKIH